MNNSEEKDDLWQLMGKAKEPVAPPFFARNVLREIRLAQEKRGGFFAWLRAHVRVHARIITLGGVAAILLVGNAVSIMRPDAFVPAAPKETVAAATTTTNGKDYEVINHLDELLAYEENSIWLDDSAK